VCNPKENHCKFKESCEKVQNPNLSFHFKLDDGVTKNYHFPVTWDRMTISGIHMWDPEGDDVCYMTLFNHGMEAEDK
jgi:hypothetical protein